MDKPEPVGSMEPLDYTPEEIAKHTARIGELTHEDCGRLWRFAPSGHPYFRSDLPLFDVFQRRFAELGGWTPELSKKIGWDP